MNLTSPTGVAPSRVVALLPAPVAFVPRLPCAKVMAASPDQLARRLQQNMLLHRGTGSAPQYSRWAVLGLYMHACKVRSRLQMLSITTVKRSSLPSAA